MEDLFFKDAVDQVFFTDPADEMRCFWSEAVEELFLIETAEPLDAVEDFLTGAAVFFFAAVFFGRPAFFAPAFFLGEAFFFTPAPFALAGAFLRLAEVLALAGALAGELAVLTPERVAGRLVTALWVLVRLRMARCPTAPMISGFLPFHSNSLVNLPIWFASVLAVCPPKRVMDVLL